MNVGVLYLGKYGETKRATRYKLEASRLAYIGAIGYSDEVRACLPVNPLFQLYGLSINEESYVYYRKAYHN